MAACYSDIVLRKGQEHVIECDAGNNLELGFQWDFIEGKDEVDLTAQAVMFDAMGNMVDSADNKQNTACNGVVIHCKDDQIGEDDEIIKINLDSLEDSVEIIMFVVSAHSGGNFASVDNTNVSLRSIQNDESQVPICEVNVDCKGENTALIMCVIHKREDKKWIVKEIGKTTEGKHFEDCREDLRKETEKFIDSELKSQRILSMKETFTMQKDDSAFLPTRCDSVIIGFGWTCSIGNTNLDASAICLDTDKKMVDIIHHARKSGEGVTHAGDNTSDGKGDNSFIRIDFNKVPEKICELYFAMNIFTNGVSFSNVSGAYVRLCKFTEGKDEFLPGHEMARYSLDGDNTNRGVVFAKLARGIRKGRWKLQAIGQSCGGQKASDPDCLDIVRGIRSPEDVVFTPEKSSGCCIIL